MQEAVEFFVAQGSYGLLFAALIAAGMGVPLPEDIVFIAGAILSQRGITNLTTTVIVLSVGVLVGDSILYFLARRLGPTIYGWRFVKRVLPQERREFIEEMVRRYGGFVVFCARHVAGLRGPTFAICAIHGISYPVFIFFDAIALAISLPLFMALGWFFADSLEEAVSGAASAEKLIMLGVLVLVILFAVVHAIRALLKRSEPAADGPTVTPSDAPPRE